MNKTLATKLSRRRFIFYVSAVAVVTAVPVYIVRTSYPKLNDWKGKILSQQQALIIIAACEVIIPEITDETIRKSVAVNIDRYIYTLPEDLSSQLNLLFTVVEHFTFLDFRVKRFTKLSITERESFLNKLNKTGADLRLVYKTLRDLCMMGYYQMDFSWKTLGYSGPVISKIRRERAEVYNLLTAQKGHLPKSIINNSVK